jgi:hypothetical protein
MSDHLPAILHEQVAAVAPISGVSMQVRDDKTKWVIGFLPAATQAQMDAAAAVVSALDIAAEDAAHEAKHVREKKVEGTKLADILIAKGVITEADLG